MKKLFALIALASLTASAKAQTPTTPPETKYKVEVSDQQGPETKEGIVFKNGNAWQVKDGKTTKLEKSVTMGNGMKVLPTGRIVMKNGEKAWLTENDFVHLDGAVEREIPVKTAGEKKSDKRHPGGG